MTPAKRFAILQINKKFVVKASSNVSPTKKCLNWQLDWWIFVQSVVESHMLKQFNANLIKKKNLMTHNE